MAKDDELKAKALEAAKERACAGLEEVWPDVWEAKRRSAKNHVEADKANAFKYNVGVTITMQPENDDLEVGGKVKWNEQYVFEMADVKVSTHPELPLNGAGAEEQE